MDVCRNYVCLHEQTANLSDCETQQHLGAVCLRNRKRKHQNVNIYEWDQLSFGDSDNSMVTEVVIAGQNRESVPRSFDPCVVGNKVEKSRDVASQKCAIVDYSTSSDDDDFDDSFIWQTSGKNVSSKVLPSESGMYETCTKTWDIDSAHLAALDRDRGKVAKLMHSGNDERLLGKSGSRLSCGSTHTTLDRAMRVLSELRSVVSRLVTKNVFPFNAEPFVRHLKHCDVLYCGDDDKDVL